MLFVGVDNVLVVVVFHITMLWSVETVAVMLSLCRSKWFNKVLTILNLLQSGQYITCSGRKYICI